MRLGLYKTFLKDGKVHDLYGKDEIDERHRHRYEVNNIYVEDIEKYTDLKFVGISACKKYMEATELKGKFWIGCQYHPEFISKFSKPHPLFIGLLEAMS